MHILARILHHGEKNSSSLSWRIMVHLAWRNLVSRKLRTFLTIFGIIIGIGAIFFLFSFGLGLQRIVQQQVIGDKSINSIDVSTPNSKILKLDAAATNKISSLGRVDRVSKSFLFPGSISFSGSETDAVVYGIDRNYASLNTFNIVAGRNLQDGDAFHVVINRGIVSSLGLKKDSDAIGKALKVVVPLQGFNLEKNELNRTFEIVGVIDSATGSEVFMPTGIFEGMGVPYYSQIKVVADKTESIAGLRKQIESQGFETTSPIDTLDQINQVFRFFTVVLVGFGSVGMLVAVLGMFNTLTISLLERTKEIGLMMALGARNRDIYRLFVLEAVLLSIAGAVLGIVGALVLGEILNLVMNGFAKGRGVTEGFDLFATPFWLMASMVVFMVIVGLLVVLFPARRARHINPIEALRRE